MLPPSDYSSNGEEDRMFRTVVEKSLPPLFTYCLRKLVLALLLFDLKVVEWVCKRFGFQVETSLSDRNVWKWKLREKLPVYRAQVEKVD